MRISDWSSDVCSSDLVQPRSAGDGDRAQLRSRAAAAQRSAGYHRADRSPRQMGAVPAGSSGGRRLRLARRSDARVHREFQTRLACVSEQTGRESGRERGWKSVKLRVVAEAIKKKKKTKQKTNN